MNKFSRNELPGNRLVRQASFALLCLFALARAEAAGFCSPPLPTDCINPQWGLVEPDGFMGMNERDGAQPLASNAAGSTHAATIRLMPVADEPAARGGRPSRSTRPLLVQDDGQRFPRETRALIAALQAASFSRKGELVSGERRIAEAVEAVRRAAPDHVLRLYIRRPRALNDRDTDVLNNRLDAINRIFKGDRYEGKPRS